MPGTYSVADALQCVVGSSRDKERRSRRESRIILRVALSAPLARARTCSAILSTVMFFCFGEAGRGLAAKTGAASGLLGMSNTSTTIV
ncbi:hypothetical protein BJY00DRAFT_171215 [Aspergillus carlsbadensis]|nr:hypothetical protein BJY00DRAFT_171215 [Aspergillus carlsbadensis]